MDGIEFVSTKAAKKEKKKEKEKKKRDVTLGNSFYFVFEIVFLVIDRMVDSLLSEQFHLIIATAGSKYLSKKKETSIREEERQSIERSIPIARYLSICLSISFIPRIWHAELVLLVPFPLPLQLHESKLRYI